MIASSLAEIDKMRTASRVTYQILREMVEKTSAGVTPVELDEHAERRCRELGAIPAFKGYRGFPACVCVSVNDEVVHTIPNRRPFQPGDLVKIDFGVSVDGYFGDAAETVAILPVPQPNISLVGAVGHALLSSVLSMSVGKKLNRIGYCVEAVAKKHGATVVRALCGHGIGKALHEDPAVLNFGHPSELRVVDGMILAVEPIIALGSGEIALQPDGWTIKTVDGAYSAHEECTVLFTKDRTEILTQ